MTAISVSAGAIHWTVSLSFATILFTLILDAPIVIVATDFFPVGYFT
ncbi:MAG: hypothetical protein Q7S89_01685 [bacterium]|nr:hypothetical protein [bacterium]